MTFEELNSVRKLKKQIADENKKLSALKIVIGALPHKYGKPKILTSNNLSKSSFENFTLQMIDTEKKIENLQIKFCDEVPKLTKKIQENFSDSTEQTLLIYRYVACKFFKEISFLLGYSEQWIYKKHKAILKKL